MDEDYEESAIAASVVALDNSRESVDDDARIVGVRPKLRLPPPVAALLMLLAHDHPIALAAFEGGRLVLRAAQHTAIDYPPGVELHLELAAPPSIEPDAPPDPPVAGVDSRLRSTEHFPWALAHVPQRADQVLHWYEGTSVLFRHRCNGGCGGPGGPFLRLDDHAGE